MLLPLFVPRVSSQVSEGDLMISVPLSSAVLITRLYLPVIEGSHVLELRVAVLCWSCHASFNWFLLLEHVYKAIARRKAVRFSSVLISTKDSYNLSVLDFTSDILDYLQEARLSMFTTTLITFQRLSISHTFFTESS